ncbi:mitochondrial pyruvate carrier 3-like isoform X3 [Rosa rugosa]|uniref:mitochondrial pyruvate carrier 3-like isoform X3 n=1 Tax=Rosa rugosa TaxID=74645 RepID=UPI002B40F173|nr:mitochondrial pyruvate carrier 3-like isoform X3 [Rosa rugosa]
MLNKQILNSQARLYGHTDRKLLLVTAIMGSGLIWTRWGTVITPKNWNLVSVNFGMAVTSMFQLARKTQHDYLSSNDQQAASESIEDQ